MSGKLITIDQRAPRGEGEFLSLDEIAQSAQIVMIEVVKLRDLAAGADGSAVRSAASATLSAVADVSSKGAQQPQPVVQEAYRSVFAKGRWLENLFGGGRQRKSKPRIVRRAWTAGGLLVSVGIAITIAAGLPWIAFGLLGMRASISWLIGQDDNLPFEGHIARDSGLAVVLRCIAGHVSDAIVLIGIIWAFANAGHPLWVAGASATMLLLFGATLFRVSAFQVGVQVGRLTIERYLRVGFMLVGLALSATPLGMMGLAIAAGGSAIYATGEIARTAYWLRQADRRSRMVTGRVDLIVREDGGVKVVHAYDEQLPLAG